MITIKKILKSINNPHLTLYRGDGYFYFEYEDQESGFWETESVGVYRLNHMSIEMWISEGQRFVEKYQNKINNMKELKS